MSDNSLGTAPASSGLATSPAAGEAAHIRRFQTFIRVPGESLSSVLAVLEHRLPPGFLAMPRHAHESAEVITVLTGELTVERDGQVRSLRAGESIAIPPRMLHTFWVSAEAPESATFVVVVAPAGLEQYYRDVARAIPTDGRPNMDVVHAAGAAHGVTVDMDSLYELIERYELQLS